MKKTALFSFAIILSLNLVAQNPNPSSVIDSVITNIMNTRHLPGVSTVIVKGGEIVWIESYGYANTNLSTPYTDTTSQLIASVSKVFTGIAIMQLYGKGLIALDDNINNYLPFEVKIPNFENYLISFRMLLTHTSSIKDGNAMEDYYNWNGDPTITLADCIQRYFSISGLDYNITDNFSNKQPGTFYKYSNMAVALEGFLVEHITGMSFNQYCKQNIFNPLCMDNTHWYLSEYQNLNLVANPHDYYNSLYEPIDHYGFADYPDGMLHTNVTDLANFMIAILQGGTFHNHTFISDTNLIKMFTPQVPLINPTQGLQFYKETLTVSSGNVLLWGHGGDEYGISTEIIFDHSNNLGIAVLANGENYAPKIVEKLYDHALTLSPSGIGNPDCYPLKIEDKPKYLFKYDISPNPASNFVAFKADVLNNKSHQITISDLTGRPLIVVLKNERKKIIDVSNLSNGVYIYSINEDDQIVTSGKLFILK